MRLRPKGWWGQMVEGWGALSPSPPTAPLQGVRLEGWEGKPAGSLGDKALAGVPRLLLKAGLGAGRRADGQAQIAE